MSHGARARMLGPLAAWHLACPVLGTRQLCGPAACQLPIDVSQLTLALIAQAQHEAQGQA